MSAPRFPFKSLTTLLHLSLASVSIYCLDECSFSSRFYSVGETWHPHLQTNGASVCATCVCHQGGKYQCTSKECIPETCPNPEEDPAKCCATCVEVPRESTWFDQTLPSKENNFFSCLHRGKIFRDGQMFVTNASVEQMHKFAPDRCVQCYCENGSVTCHVPTCNPLSCSRQMRVPGNCCPLCHGEFVDCHSGGQLYAHGVVWYLNLGMNKLGCEECTCNYGQIECHPLRCPSGRRSCSTLRNHQIPERCCSACLRNRTRNDVGVNQGKQQREQASAEDENAPCLTKRNNVLVYKSEAKSNSSGYSQFLFVFTNKRAQLHSWTLVHGKIGNFSTQHLNDDDARSVRKAFRFRLLGATNARSLHRFTNREKKVKEKCKERCGNRIKRLENALKLKRVKNKCRNDENLSQF